MLILRHFRNFKLTISRILRFPYENITALGGVAIGKANARLTDKIIGSKR
jgi:hypothetical protein